MTSLAAKITSNLPGLVILNVRLRRVDTAGGQGLH